MGLVPDRKNLKIDEETFQQLSDAKRDGETWDGFLLRLLDESNTDLETMLRTVFRDELERFAKERDQE